MNIQFNTDKHLAGHDKLVAQYTTNIADSLTRFSQYITSVEVHMSDENGQKSGPKDKKCVLEVRAKNIKPIAVSHMEGSMDQALKGALTKVKTSLDTVLGKLSDH